jgi:hypothetical protein
MNKLSKLISRLLVIARAPDTKYLIGLNLQAIQKTRGKPGPDQDPRTFYQAIQQEATKGPIFLEPTLKFMDKLDLDLTKDEVKWIATRYQKKAKIKVDELRNVLDYIRSEKPDLSKLSYTKAVQNSIQWHEQFKGKADSTGEYNTKNVILKLTNGYTWVEVPAEDLKTEGSNMGHCVGGSVYVRKVNAGSIKILSLRDSGNKPHVTIEITKAGDVVQVQGKQNEEPVAKYHAAIEQLWNHLKIKHNSNTGKYIIDPKVLTELAANKTTRSVVASNPRLPVEFMRKFVVDKDLDVRELVAQNPSLPVDVMHAIAKENDSLILSLVYNPNLPIDILTKFSRSKSVDVRFAVSQHPKLTIDLMKTLVRDKSSYIRSGISKNTKLPLKFMQVLAKDKNVVVRWSLASNPNLPSDILHVLASDKDYEVRETVASHPNTTVDTLELLAKDATEDVLSALIANPKLPLKIVEDLARSKVPSIREEARARLMKSHRN